MKKQLLFLAFVVMTITFFTSTVSADELPYIIEDGSIYYESSYGFGSGRHAVVCLDNPYTTTPCYAGINGYSYLDQNGCSILSDYDESATNIQIPPAPEGAVKLFKHFKTLHHRNGWVDSDKVITITTMAEEVDKEKSTPTPAPVSPLPEKQDSKQLANMIQSYEGMKVVIVDRSSSMDDFANQATKEFRKLEIDESNTKVYVFGRYFKEIKPKDIADDSNRDVRKHEEKFDHLAAVINDAAKYNPKHIILLTDLGVYDEKFTHQSNLETIDLLVPFDWTTTTFTKERVQYIKNSFDGVTINIRQFDD